ncbi:hypothetical protein CHM34_13110 [Paludifilum halophilum]|uniref:Uncharacterized protein n=1 Tax=Paludifilum halophilum TaxID=1642702 RepID=A0A235B4P8_9BACL|nr:hypothetical protein CHM34_13110 [Paludifilum halophilum]
MNGNDKPKNKKPNESGSFHHKKMACQIASHAVIELPYPVYVWTSPRSSAFTLIHEKSERCETFFLSPFL